MILDLAVIILIILFSVSGYRKGLIYSVAGVFGTLIASAGSSFLATFLAYPVYDGLIKEKVIETSADILNNGPNLNSSAEKAQELFDSVPSVIYNSLSDLGIDVNSLASQISGTSKNAVPQMIESMLRPTMINIVTMALTAILFIILTVIIKLTTNFLTKAIDFANLSTVNRVAGAVIGIAEAILTVMIFSLVFDFIIVFLSPDTYHAVHGVVNSSLLYSGIYELNLPSAIISAMTFA